MGNHTIFPFLYSIKINDLILNSDEIDELTTAFKDQIVLLQLIFKYVEKRNKVHLLRVFSNFGD